MLALWSRVAQSPGTCRCISCVSNVRLVVRRRGLRGLWALRTPTSTFWYTAVFAAGLSIDAKAKADRNKQWEEAFAQLRDAMHHQPEPNNTPGRTASGPASATHNASVSGSLLEEADWQDALNVAGMELGDDTAMLEHHISHLRTSPHIWDDLRFDSRLPGAQVLDWPANTGAPLNPYHLPPQSLWAPDVLRWSALRQRQSRKKLALQELSTGFLIFKLIRDVGFKDSHKVNASLNQLAPAIRQIMTSTDTSAETARTAFMMDMERLHMAHVSNSPEHFDSARLNVESSWIPHYYQDPDGDYYDICKQMNNGITQLLNASVKGNRGEKPLLVAKICHNLLISTAAPDLHTFNILIAGFSLWRRTLLVDNVIAAFYASKVRPNELLCTQILHHYTNTARPDHFARFVSMMRGVDGDALTLANPLVNINEASQGRLVRLSPDKVLQKVHPTPMVYAALISGVLKFAGFDRALDVYYEMKADGWGLAVPGLTKLLFDCIRRADWEGGTYVWEEINSIKTKVKPSYVARAYHHMLSLCSVTGNTVAFNQVLNEVAKRGFDQKSIINAAMETTRWAQRPAPHAPAWAADNVMIAVSGYMNESGTVASEVNGVSHGDPEFSDSSFGQPTHDDDAVAPTGNMNTTPSKDFDSTNTEEAWSSWIEHELGQKPKDPKL
jgi:hypothetical protein